jgi:hypothetical protein
VGERKTVYRILVGMPEGKRTLGRTRSRWVDVIKMDLTEIGWGGMDWIDLAQNMDQWRVLHKMLGNSRVAAQLTASQEGLSSMELVTAVFLHSLSCKSCIRCCVTWMY